MENDALEQWISQVEDKAWLAKSNAMACRFLVGNLLMELQRLQLMDARAFISRLRRDLPDMDNKQAELGLVSLLDDLLNHLPTSSGNQDGGSPGGTTFH